MSPYPAVDEWGFFFFQHILVFVFWGDIWVLGILQVVPVDPLTKGVFFRREFGVY